MTKCKAAWRSVLEDPGDAQNSSRWFYESRCLNLRRNNKQSYREMNVGSTLVYFRADSCRKRMWLRTLPVGQEACLIDGKSLARYFLNPQTLLSEGPWEWSSSIKLSQNIFLAAHTHHPRGLNLEKKDNTIHIFFTIYSLLKVYDADTGSEATRTAREIGSRLQKIEPLKIKWVHKNSQ